MLSLTKMRPTRWQTNPESNETMAEAATLNPKVVISLLYSMHINLPYLNFIPRGLNKQQQNHQHYSRYYYYVCTTN